MVKLNVFLSRGVFDMAAPYGLNFGAYRSSFPSRFRFQISSWVIELGSLISTSRNLSFARQPELSQSDRTLRFRVSSNLDEW